MKNSYFKKAVEAGRNLGRDNVPPSYHKDGVIYLQKKVWRIKKVALKKYKEWNKTDCTLIDE